MGFRYREIGPSRQINDGTNSITGNYAQQKYFATLNCAFPVLGVARGLQLSAVSRILAFCLATRRCSATGLHKLGARYAVQLRTMPTITAALVGATLGQELNTNRAWQPIAHTVILGEHKANVNSRPF